MKNFDISGWIITFIKQEYKLLFKEIVMKLSKTSIQNIEEIIHFQADILNNIRDCVIVVDLEGKIVFWNKGAENLYGYSADEVLGQFISILYSDNTPNFERDFEDTKQSIKNGIEFTGVFNGRKKDGTSVSADFRRTYLEDEKGNVIGFISVSRDATELKKAEEHIKKANLYHRGLIEASLDPLVTIGPDGKIMDVNSATELVTGYSRDELIGTDFSDYFTEPERARKGYQRVFKKGSVKDYELEIKHKKGYSTPVSYNASIYKDENGEVTGVFAAARDITELKIAEKALITAHDNLEVKVNERTKELEEAYNALSEGKSKLRIAMDIAKVVSWEYDVESDMFTFDDHFYALYGTTAKKEGGTKMLSEEYARKFIPPEESPLVGKTIAKALKTDDPNFVDTIEHSIIRADGKKRFIVVRYGVIKDDEGRTIKTYGANQDITERKKAEKEIKRRTRRMYILNKIIITANRSNDIGSLLKDVLDLSMKLMNFESGGIYLVDEDLKIANLIFTKGVQNDFIKIMGKLDIDEFPYSQVLKDGKSLFMENYDIDYPDISKRRKLKSALFVPIFSDEKIVGAFFLASHERHHFTEEEKRLINAIGREIGNTYSKLVYEENLKNIVKELKRSNEELEQFAYITSHDLQEPLRTIASFTQLLQMRYKDKFDSDADEFMGYMVDASIRMKEMIQGLLNYSRIGKEGMNFEPINLENIVNEALSNLRFVIEENNAAIYYYSLPSVIGDSKLLVQLFQNLISNAIKFKGDKSPEINISAAKSEKEDKFVICVEDNGIGIDPQYADRIFKVFKRLHTMDEYEGAGIGLSISRRIVENHGGKMWLESEPNKGSKFCFTLNPVK